MQEELFDLLTCMLALLFPLIKRTAEITVTNGATVLPS